AIPGQANRHSARNLVAAPPSHALSPSLLVADPAARPATPSTDSKRDLQVMADPGRILPFAYIDVDRDPNVRLVGRTMPRLESPVPKPTQAPLALHRLLPGYQETALVSLPHVAQELGLESLHIKDESRRLGQPSFKVLGASWAVYRALSERLGVSPAEGATVGELASVFAPLAPLILVSATDGNHGRALAHVARLFGFEARILVPAGTAKARIEAIEGEGATVEVVEGSYDKAVETAAAMEGERAV